MIVLQTVSYTHLDVYKRQIHGWKSYPFKVAYLLFHSEYMSNLLWGFADEESNALCRYFTVSYTHLIDHCWYDSAQKKVGSGRTLFASGGLSMILEKLAEVEDRQKKLDAQI